MDPEQTFLRVHARLSGMLSQLLTPRIRLALEYIYLGVAVALLCLLVVMHTNFVQQPGCSSEFSGIEFTEAQLVQIKITGGGLWDTRSADQILMGLWNQGSSTENPEIPEVNVQWLERRSQAFEPMYLYTIEKGYFLLSEGAKSRHGVQTINITLSAQNSCFGNRWQQLLINGIVGYDTILINSLLSSPGQGYLYNFQTKELYDLSYGHEPAAGPTRFGDYVVTKCGVLIMSLFVFFTTTMSVSFTLRETQSRMLKFTVQLQHHARHQLPTFQLIFVHVIESLVFVPIMIGILFFLFEFYDDQVLAFLVLTLVWLCELFMMISVRTSISVQFFPRFFFLYFLVFHVYFFSYAYGFSYLAFSTTAAFMQHLILYFWNRFEVPALQQFIRNRAHPQQQPGVQIASSTIYASTFHIARINATEAGTENSGLGTAEDLHTVPNHSMTDLSGPTENIGSSHEEDEEGNLLPFPDPASPQQAENAAPGGGHSLLLWLLGRASSEGIVSFFSMSRDVRDQGQDFSDSPTHNNENEQAM